MKNRWGAVVLLFFTAGASAQYKTALPGYGYKFPRDHFNHADYQTEWWYYTGNVKAADGHRFGFELTFFRQGVSRDERKASNPWDVQDLYFAHLALSDLDGGKFFHAERTNRKGPGIAGINEDEGRIWNGNWQATWRGDNQNLQGVGERFAFRLALQSAKAPVIQGENGVSQKAAGRGRASHYISLTRLNTAGEIQVADKTFNVAGTAWMDHEFFTHQLERDQVGWDWVSIQLEDDTEVMLFRIRRADGSIDPFSSGTFVDARGNTTHLKREDFVFTPRGTTWISQATRGIYPVAWTILIAKLGMALNLSTPLASQELASSMGLLPAYWEGAVVLHGTKSGTPVNGVGYLEMTGYDHSIEVLR